MVGPSAENSVRVGLVLTHQYRTGSDLTAAVAEQRETLHFIRDRGWDSGHRSGSTFWPNPW